VQAVTGTQGAHNRAQGPREVARTPHDFHARVRNEFELTGVLPRTGPKGLARLGGPFGSRLPVKVYADLNTFSKALVPQSE
jgi:hypothetical protein